MVDGIAAPTPNSDDLDDSAVQIRIKHLKRHFNGLLVDETAFGNVAGAGERDTGQEYALFQNKGPAP